MDNVKHDVQDTIIAQQDAEVSALIAQLAETKEQLRRCALSYNGTLELWENDIEQLRVQLTASQKQVEALRNALNWALQSPDAETIARCWQVLDDTAAAAKR